MLNNLLSLRGRLPEGFTINLTPSMNIGGVSINSYLYVIAGAIFLIIYIGSFFRDGRCSLMSATGATLKFLFGAWVILTINTLINYVLFYHQALK